MKANELMIGDWVYAIDDNGEKHPCRVNDLKYDYINKCDDFCIDFYGTTYNPEWPDTFNVEPIPLTSEILEKNFPKPTDGLTWFPEEGGFNCHTYVPKCEINAFGLFKYVHELQHAIRLCKIEKEIIVYE